MHYRRVCVFSCELVAWDGSPFWCLIMRELFVYISMIFMYVEHSLHVNTRYFVLSPAYFYQQHYICMCVYLHVCIIHIKRKRPSTQTHTNLLSAHFLTRPRGRQTHGAPLKCLFEHHEERLIRVHGALKSAAALSKALEALDFLF